MGLQRAGHDWATELVHNQIKAYCWRCVLGRLLTYSPSSKNTISKNALYKKLVIPETWLGSQQKEVLWMAFGKQIHTSHLTGFISVRLLRAGNIIEFTASSYKEVRIFKPFDHLRKRIISFSHRRLTSSPRIYLLKQIGLNCPRDMYGSSVTTLFQ